jgi:Heparinase II/III-like protein
VLFVKPRYWVVVDDLDGAAQHRLDLRFQFAPVDLTLDGSGWVIARGTEGRGLLLRTLAAEPLTMDVHEGALSPRAGWVSPDYGRRVPAPAVVCSTEARLPLRLVTLLVPVEDTSATPPAVSHVADECGAIAGIELGELGDRIGIDEDLVWCDSPAGVAAG